MRRVLFFVLICSFVDLLALAAVKQNKLCWTEAEDAILRSIVEQDKIWLVIEEEFNKQVLQDRHRKGKQCRERWQNHLHPDLNKSPFTEEDKVLFGQAMQEHGTKWATIRDKYFPDRSDAYLKNKGHSLLHKERKQTAKRIGAKSLQKRKKLKVPSAPSDDELDLGELGDEGIDDDYLKSLTKE